MRRTAVGRVSQRAHMVLLSNQGHFITKIARIFKMHNLLKCLGFRHNRPKHTPKPGYDPRRRRPRWTLSQMSCVPLWPGITYSLTTNAASIFCRLYRLCGCYAASKPGFLRLALTRRRASSAPQISAQAASSTTYLIESALLSSSSFSNASLPGTPRAEFT